MAGKRTRTDLEARLSAGPTQAEMLVSRPRRRGRTCRGLRDALEDRSSSASNKNACGSVLAANAAMVLLYWDIGRMILERQERAGLGREGDRPPGRGPARGVPRHEGLLAAQPQVHARLCRGVAGRGQLCKQAACTIALVPQHRVCWRR